jgi:hypothetical protein
MLFRVAVPAVMLVAVAGAPAVAAPKLAQPAKMGPACEAALTTLNQKIDPTSLPMKVLVNEQAKVGPYVPDNPQKKLGGIKANTVMTGTVEYQDGANRRTAPFICMGTEKEAGFVYTSRGNVNQTDRAIAPVQECYDKNGGTAGPAAASCIQAVLSKTEEDLKTASSAARTKAEAVGPDEVKNFDASAQEYTAYRTRSCSVFRAVDAVTDAPDFLNACFARLNLARSAKLTGAISPTQ